MQRGQRGVSLIELMIGLVLGLHCLQCERSQRPDLGREPHYVLAELWVAFLWHRDRTGF